jgi:hypothetical protein
MRAVVRSRVHEEPPEDASCSSKFLQGFVALFRGREVAFLVIEVDCSIHNHGLSRVVSGLAPDLAAAHFRRHGSKAEANPLRREKACYVAPN